MPEEAVVFDNPGESTAHAPDLAVTPEPVAQADPAVVVEQVEVDPFDNEELKSFPREYVQKLRGENAKVRTDYTPYKEVFGTLEPEARDYVLGLVKGIVDFANGDSDAAEPTAAELEYLLGKMKPAAPTTEELKAAAENDDKPLTIAEWKAIQAKEDEKRLSSESDARMWAEIESLGYSQDIKVDKYGDTAALLAVATSQTKGDLKAAAALRAERFEAELEKAVATRIAGIRAGTAKWPNVSEGGAAPAPTKEKTGPKTAAERRRAVNSRLDRIFGAEDGTGGGN